MDVETSVIIINVISYYRCITDKSININYFAWQQQQHVNEGNVEGTTVLSYSAILILYYISVIM